MRRRLVLGALAALTFTGVAPATPPAPAPLPPTGALAAARSGVPARESSDAAREPLPPVLLIPGWGDGRAELDPLRHRFVAAGWDSAMVSVVEFRDPVGSNREHAREIAVAAAELRARTGAAHLDFVAHSMGGLALRYHLRRRAPPGDGVRRIVFLATPHFGTWSSLVAWGDGAREMTPGSDFLVGLMDGRPIPAGVEALTIRTPLDLHILPGESTAIPGVDHVEICCPTHAGLLDDARVFEVVATFLRRPPD